MPKASHDDSTLPSKMRLKLKKTLKKSSKDSRQSSAQKTSGPRRLKPPKRVWYKPQTWRKPYTGPTPKPLPKARHMFSAANKLLYANWKLFGGISLIYGLLTLLLVRGLSVGSELTTLKDALNSLGNGFANKTTTALTSFAYLFSTSGSGTATGGIYQSVLLIVCSLAVIWALRQVLAGNAVRIRDGFYQGMYPLIPFILVFLMLGLQLLPLALGGGLYSLVTANGIAVHVWEKASFIAIFALSGLWSLRMITGTIFALYIVTLPDMTPLKALRSAKSLVTRRRLLIWRKLIFLPFVLLLIAAAVEIPLILFLTPAAQWAFLLLSTASLAVIHSYVYHLYRELL